MNKSQFQQLSDQYKKNLVDDVIPFWQKHSMDKIHGGFFTCLDRCGNVYDTDKFVWLQARQTWMFSKLYNVLEKKSEWLEILLNGAEFLKKWGRDQSGNWFFSLTRAGTPLIAPYNIFSDCFASMAFAQAASATGRQEYRDIALATYRNILKRRSNPKGPYTKAISGTRPLETMSVPMILSNLVLELEPVLSAEELNQTVEWSMKEVMGRFVDPKLGIAYEFIAPDGSHPDCFEGRLINPGHGIEAMWFMMDLAERTKRNDLVEKAVDTMLRILEFGWDKEFGGIFMFLDAQSKPPMQLEWDQKLWWVHVESLIALVKAFRLTRRKECLDWYKKVHEYTWSHFPDPECGEWWGYLNRKGEVLIPAKGGKWKGCYHVPRGLLICHQEFNALVSKEMDC